MGTLTKPTALTSGPKRREGSEAMAGAVAEPANAESQRSEKRQRRRQREQERGGQTPTDQDVGFFSGKPQQPYNPEITNGVCRLSGIPSDIRSGSALCLELMILVSTALYLHSTPGHSFR